MTIFQAHINLPLGALPPENYDDSLGISPGDGFVVSKTKEGQALSLYGDWEWDWTPYQSDGRICVFNFKFWREGGSTPQREALARELRWLMFVTIYLKPGLPLSSNSLKNKIIAFSELARFCDARSIQIRSALADTSLLVASVGNRGGLALRLFSLIRLCKKLGPKKAGFEVVSPSNLKGLLKVVQAWRDNLKQHPPIPTHLYSSVLSRISNELREFERVQEQFILLLNECAEDPLVGRLSSTQWRTRQRQGLVSQSTRPGFPELLQKYQLAEFWNARGYEKSVRGLSSAITETLMVASLQIQAYTGMRFGEVSSLACDCLETAKRDDDGGTVYFVAGIVSKSTHGRPMAVRWVTSESGAVAVRIAQRIAKAIYESANKKASNRVPASQIQHLFISPAFAIKGGRNLPQRMNLVPARYPGLRSRLLPVIEERDLVELEAIDPHRAWRFEDEFELGRRWPFTTHQFRRSLALYAQRSGLVSLPSLKRQLQHVTEAMTLYYGRGSAFAENFVGGKQSEEHFSKEWQQTQAVSQFLSYVANVLDTEEHLFGAHANWIMHRMRGEDGKVLFDRSTTLKKFQRGEMAYRETMLGGCVKVGECDNSPLDLFEIDCLTKHCKNLVGHTKKLERVVSAQAKLVDRLAQLDAESPECRFEKGNLDVLSSALARVRADGCSSADGI